jgi:hypothetical protein
VSAPARRAGRRAGGGSAPGVVGGRAARRRPGAALLARGDARWRCATGARARGLGAALLLALALGGCESSQEKSAQLERQVKLARAQHPEAVAKGLAIARASSAVRVLETQTVHTSEGTAVVVTLRNASTHTLRDVPIAIAVKGASGGTLYQNNAPGLEAALTSVPLLAPGQQFSWVDDQVQASETPASVSAVVGEAPRAAGAIPQIVLTGVHADEESASPGIAGTIHNDSAVAQQSLVVYGLARRGTRVVAAGRAVLSEVPAHHALPFQVLLIGSASGAKVEASAPPSTL